MRPLHNVEYFKNTSFMIFPVFNTYRSMTVPESIVEKVKEEMKLINETGVETDAAEDYSQDEPIAETTSKNKDAAIAEPEPESEAEPGSDKKKLGQDDHDYRHHHHHDHDHNELGHGHVHGSQGRNVVGGSTSAGSVSKFEAVTWMITTLTSLGLVMNQNGIWLCS